jgi:hypothetical protein
LENLYIILSVAGGLVLGFVIAWLMGRTKVATLKTELEMTKASSEENLKILDTARESFQALSPAGQTGAGKTTGRGQGGS